jgi:2'-5' RNA ligase
MKNACTYFLAFEIDPIFVGDVYEKMPLYCTLMHRFHSELAADQIAAAIAPLIAKCRPLLLEPSEHTAFGPNRILVTKLEPTKGLLDLHQQVFTILTGLGVHYTESDWVGDGYIPHVTDQAAQRYNPEQPAVAQSVFLARVEFPLQGNRRFIEAKFPFFAA